jgi:divalent metal cation (Fe/Co/Zn/Cd) transporter
LINVHGKEVDEMTAQLSGAKVGLVAYIACYSKVLQIIEEGLDEETQEKYQAEAKQWSEQKPPPQIQQRYVMPTILSDQN